MPRTKTVRNLSEPAPEIILYGEIGGLIDTNGVLYQLEQIDAPRMCIRLNSPGGDVFEAIAIMNALRNHPAKVTTMVEGLAASAASVLAVGASDELVMCPHSEMMIHHAWSTAVGDFAELNRIADRLAAESRRIAGVYAEKTGRPVDDWLEMMTAETWFTAEEAVEVGLADRVGDSEPVAARFDSPVMAKFRYKSRGEAPSPGLFSCAKHEEESVSFLDSIAVRLGLRPGEEEQAVLAALDERLADDPETTVGDEVLAALDEGTSVEAPAGDEEPTGQVEQAAENTEGTEGAEGAEDDEPPAEDDEEEESPDDLIQVTRGDWEDLRSLAEEGLRAREEQRQKRAVAFAQNAVDEGRIGAARKQAWVARWLEDSDRAEADMRTLPKNLIPRVEMGHGADSDTPGVDARRVLGAAGINLSPSV